MTARTRPMPWFKRLFGRAASADADDAADLGTAFGLDYVLDEKPAPVARAAMPQTLRPADRARGWRDDLPR